MIPNAKKAIETYKELFGATLDDWMPFDEKVGVEMGLPADTKWEETTMHSQLDIGGAKINMSDSGPMERGKVDVLLMLDSKEQIEEIWARVKEKGYTIIMEMEVQFWGAMYGRFIDEYGVGWQLNYNVPQ